MAEYLPSIGDREASNEYLPWIGEPKAPKFGFYEIVDQKSKYVSHVIPPENVREKIDGWDQYSSKLTLLKNTGQPFKLENATVLVTRGFLDDFDPGATEFDPKTQVAIAKLNFSRLPAEKNFLFTFGIYAISVQKWPPDSLVGHDLLCIVKNNEVTVWNSNGGGKGMILIAQALTNALNDYESVSSPRFSVGTMDLEDSEIYTFAIQKKLGNGVSRLCQSLVVIKAEDLMKNGFPGILETQDKKIFDNLETFCTDYAEFSKPTFETEKSHGEWAGTYGHLWKPKKFSELVTPKDSHFLFLFEEIPLKEMREGHVGSAGALQILFQPPELGVAVEMAETNLDKYPEMAEYLLKNGVIDTSDTTLPFIKKLMETESGQEVIHDHVVDLFANVNDLIYDLDDDSEVLTTVDQPELRLQNAIDNLPADQKDVFVKFLLGKIKKSPSYQSFSTNIQTAIHSEGGEQVLSVLAEIKIDKKPNPTLKEYLLEKFENFDKKLLNLLFKQKTVWEVLCALFKPLPTKAPSEVAFVDLVHS